MTIDKIINSPILLDPWEHKVVDDILPDQVFKKVQEAAKFLTKYTIDGKTNPIWINEALTLGVKQDCVDSIINFTDQILDNIDDILAGFSTTNKSLHGYYSLPKFGVSGKNFMYPIHSESSHKVLLIVIYLEPEIERGTRLYTGQQESDFHKEIEWKPNRALIICPNGNNDETWHTWKNTNGEPRVTLNIYASIQSIWV